MRILVAPDSFKETLSASEAATAIAEGIRRADPSITVDLCPIADGGEGTVRTMITATGGMIHHARVTGPLGTAVDAEWGSFEGADSMTRIGVIEIAAAAGLHLIRPADRNPMKTTTFGVGQLISHAVESGCDPIIIGLGGSATCDGGTGMAQALRCGFTLTGRGIIDGLLTGGHLSAISAIERSTIPPEFNDGRRLLVACDVDNPLCGPHGSAAVYGPQKGATPEQVAALDAGLMHLSSLLPDVDSNFPGAGAAGGLGFGFKAFCNAQIERGIDIVLRTVDFRARVAQADLIITGEGCIDAQTLHGKAIYGVACMANQTGVPVIALAGTTGAGAEHTTCPTANGALTSYHCLTNDLGLASAQAMQNAGQHLSELAQQVIADRLRSHTSR